MSFPTKRLSSTNRNKGSTISFLRLRLTKCKWNTTWIESRMTKESQERKSRIGLTTRMKSMVDKRIPYSKSTLDLASRMRENLSKLRISIRGLVESEMMRQISLTHMNPEITIQHCTGGMIGSLEAALAEVSLMIMIVCQLGH